MPASPGALRFNSDSNKLELYDGNQWTEIVASSPDSQTGGARGVIASGYQAAPAPTSIDYITISTTGNSINFGNLTAGRYAIKSASDKTRGVFAGGRNDPTPAAAVTTIDYITIASGGNATSFGSLSTATTQSNGGNLGNTTRGIFAGVDNGSNANSIIYITIQSTGTPQDFGDLNTSNGGTAQCCSSTRGVVAGNAGSPGTVTSNVMDFITISTLGNAADFGDLITPFRNASGISNAVRGVFGSGGTPSSPSGIGSNIMEFITIATLGNSTDFGDLSDTRRSKGSMSSPTRGVFAAGADPNSNIMEYITIMSAGNAIDFGDLSRTAEAPGSVSNAHGGL